MVTNNKSPQSLGPQYSEAALPGVPLSGSLPGFEGSALLSLWCMYLWSQLPQNTNPVTSHGVEPLHTDWQLDRHLWDLYWLPSNPCMV